MITGSALRRHRYSPARFRSAVRAVICDLDGTLVDSEPAYMQAFQAALADMGLELPGTTYRHLIGQSTPDRIAALRHMLGPQFAPSLFLGGYYRRKRLLHRSIRPKPGANSLISSIRALGIPVAVVTSASFATASALLKRVGLAGQVDAVITRDDVRNRKPHPEPFLRAAAILGADPAVCLVLEDSAIGLCSARNAGMMPVLIPDLAPVSPDALAAARLVLPNLHAVDPLLTGS